MKPNRGKFLGVSCILIVLIFAFVAAGQYFIAFLIFLLTLVVASFAIWPDKLGRTRRKRVVWHYSSASTTTFGSPAASASRSVAVTMAGVAIADLLDPVTGVGFTEGEEIWQCGNCSSLYHSESRDFVSEQNANCCVVCKAPNQISRFRFSRQVARPVTTEIARRFRPEVITTANVRRNIGRIVVFEGEVVDVQQSRTSETYAVKFQRGRWVDAFKLVIFPQYVHRFSGGSSTITSYQGHRIRVRGLIQKHDVFGLQIIVDREDMIEVLD